MNKKEIFIFIILVFITFAIAIFYLPKFCFSDSFIPRDKIEWECKLFSSVLDFVDSKLPVSPTPLLQIDEDMFKDSDPVLSPDGKKQVFVRDYGDNREVILKIDGKEKVLYTIYGILVNVGSWSPDSTQFTYSIGTSSAGYNTVVMNIETGKTIDLDDFFEFDIHPKSGVSYGHIYAGVLDWRNNDELITIVIGLSDFGGPDGKEYFLVNAKTGKVIKRIL